MPLTAKGKIFKAVRKNDIRTVTRLLDHGYNPNTAYWDGDSALLMAAYLGRPEIFEVLVARGADPFGQHHHQEMTTGIWQTLLHVAAANGHKQIVDFLLEGDKYDKALINRIDNNRNTALHLAAAGGHLEIVRTLLAHGFDPAMTGANGKLAVGFAFQGKHAAVVELLQAHKKPATPQPAPPLEKKPEPAASDWKLLNPDTVARVCDVGGVGYKITDVFNFAAGERIRIVNNLKTKADHVETTPFSNLSDRRQLEEAFDALQALGGKADAKALGDKAKPRLPPPEKKGP
ncbi:MAG TPA: ankyrin repeat domain-containing protein [Patescibacteria group bacterium]|nr:ankyrin repeat domain-containing protein [Patescibacteria group bacterium]